MNYLNWIVVLRVFEQEEPTKFSKTRCSNGVKASLGKQSEGREGWACSNLTIVNLFLSEYLLLLRFLPKCTPTIYASHIYQPEDCIREELFLVQRCVVDQACVRRRKYFLGLRRSGLRTMDIRGRG
jgi:hypothetical protein